MHAICAVFKYGKIRSVIALILCFGILIIPNIVSAEEPDGVTVPSMVLAEAKTLQLIREKDADTPRPVAGLSKLPALLLLCEGFDQGQLDVSAMISVSDYAARIPGPTAFLETGEQILAGELLKAACMICAGDAITALGENMFGSQSAFLLRIQQRMEELDIMISLSDCVGSNLEMSPNMLLKLGQALIKSETFQKNCVLTLETLYHADGRETELVNANRMLKTYAGCLGTATGSSQDAGYCGLFYAVHSDTEMFCVVLGAKNANERFKTATSLFDHAFSTLKCQTFSQEGSVVKESIPVHGGLRREINLVAKETVVKILDKNTPALQMVELVPDGLQAPLDTKTVLGSISYQTAKGEEIALVELVAQHPVEAASLRDFIRSVLLRGFLHQ